jgi:hypothetical protein
MNQKGHCHLWLRPTFGHGDEPGSGGQRAADTQCQYKSAVPGKEGTMPLQLKMRASKFHQDRDTLRFLAHGLTKLLFVAPLVVDRATGTIVARATIENPGS